MNEPPIGMKCSDCGCCLAAVKAGDDWLCWECDAGEPCKGKSAPQPPPAYRAVPTRPFVATPATMGTFAGEFAAIEANDPAYPKLEEKPAPVKEKPVTIHSSNKTTKRIPDDVRRAIIAADPSISHSDLARQHGISDVTVYTIRKKAGITLVKGARAGKSKRQIDGQRGGKVTQAKRRISRKQVDREANAALPEAKEVTISIQLNDVAIESLWKMLSTQQKQIAIRAALENA